MQNDGSWESRLPSVRHFAKKPDMFQGRICTHTWPLHHCPIRVIDLIERIHIMPNEYQSINQSVIALSQPRIQHEGQQNKKPTSFWCKHDDYEFHLPIIEECKYKESFIHSFDQSILFGFSSMLSYYILTRGQVFLQPISNLHDGRLWNQLRWLYYEMRQHNVILPDSNESIQVGSSLVVSSSSLTCKIRIRMRKRRGKKFKPTFAEGLGMHAFISQPPLA